MPEFKSRDIEFFVMKLKDNCDTMLNIMKENHHKFEVQSNWENDADFKKLGPEEKAKATTARLTDRVAGSVGLSLLRAQGLIPE